MASEYERGVAAGPEAAARECDRATEDDYRCCGSAIGARIRALAAEAREREAGPAEAPHRVGDVWELDGYGERTTVARVMPDGRLVFDERSRFGGSWDVRAVEGAGWRRVRCADDVRVLDEEDGDPAEEE